ncbi:hypothetical protein [Agrobacterium larrymoorei]|uniref:Uncharacterized protein n=1 Tax=Agrobacterium larrymoorei TaxID=160699 RepID=A0A4D7E164_9HYPH|nr:hypothetical protein [Agrobacterium larrymoorei]QCJ00073.1 hypothetical protein CFBP5473_19240 [Agrobacterium larrymoorei]QYA09485.1 hypothetical protein J5285_19110 [Agrobacterium larrymoorei]
MRYKETANAYANWIDERIKNFTDPDRPIWQPLESYMQFHALFVTFSFDSKKIAGRKSEMSDSSSPIYNHKLSPEFLNTDRLYKRMCRELLGSNFTRKRDCQPLMIAAADGNGTRYWGTTSDLQNLHIHSIWVFKPGQIEKAKKKFATIDIQTCDYDFSDVDVRDFTNYMASVGRPSKIASYTSKFLGFNAMDMLIGEDFVIYPTI